MNASKRCPDGRKFGQSKYIRHGAACWILATLLTSMGAASAPGSPIATILKEAEAAQFAGNLKQAIKLVRKAERKHQRHAEADELSITLMELYLAQSSYDRAYKQLQKVKKQFPESDRLEMATWTMCSGLAARPVVVSTVNTVHEQPVHYLSTNPTPRSSVKILAMARDLAPADPRLAGESADSKSLYYQYKLTDTAKTYGRLGQARWRQVDFDEAAQTRVKKGPIEARVQSSSRHRMVGSVTRYRHAHEVHFRRTENLRMSIADFSQCKSPAAAPAAP